MNYKKIPINEIKIDDSKYSLYGVVFTDENPSVSSNSALEKLGILQPVIVQQDGNGSFHLIDGYKRTDSALRNNVENLDAVLLPQDTKTEDILILLLYDNLGIITSSVMNRVQFIQFSLSLGAGHAWIQDALCVPFGFRPYKDFFQDLQKIMKMSEPLRIFCHEKRYSLKQILNLTHYPVDLMQRIIEWKGTLHLTASVLDEIASNLRDYLKSENKGIEDFVHEQGVQEIIDSSLSLRDRTERLRRFIYGKRFPTLSSVNKKIAVHVKALGLPPSINIQWDSTLENKNLDLTLHIQDAKQWPEILKKINSEEVKKALQDILDDL